MKKFTKKYKRKFTKIYIEKNHEKWIKRRVMKSYKKFLKNPNSGTPSEKVFEKIRKMIKVKRMKNLQKFFKKQKTNQIWKNFQKNLWKIGEFMRK